MRRNHPCIMEASLGDVLLTGELLLTIVSSAGPQSTAALGATSSAHAADTERAHACLGTLAPQAMYICGGRDGQRCLNSVERLDPTTGTWEPMAGMLQHRAAAAAATLEGRLYVCGGWSGQQYLSSV